MADKLNIIFKKIVHHRIQNKKTTNKYTVCYQQQANGILDTCTDSVNLCIGLIGIMAFFMGIMSIAEKAGGIRLLIKNDCTIFYQTFS